jgi:hypothetical protein
MKAYGVVDEKLHSFFTWAYDGGEWSTSHFDLFTPGERDPSAYLIAHLLGPTARLDAVMSKITHPCPGNLPSVVQPVASIFTGSSALVTVF